MNSNSQIMLTLYKKYKVAEPHFSGQSAIYLRGYQLESLDFQNFYSGDKEWILDQVFYFLVLSKVYSKEWTQVVLR